METRETWLVGFLRARILSEYIRSRRSMLMLRLVLSFYHSTRKPVSWLNNSVNTPLRSRKNGRIVEVQYPDPSLQRRFTRSTLQTRTIRGSAAPICRQTCSSVWRAVKSHGPHPPDLDFALPDLARPTSFRQDAGGFRSLDGRQGTTSLVFGRKVYLNPVSALDS